MKAVRLPKTRSRAGIAPLTGKAFAPKTILVPVDFSPLSRAAMEKAVEMAAQFGSKVLLLHVVEPVISPVEYAIVPQEMQDINIQLLAERKTRLAGIQEKITDGGVTCSAEVKLGKPWHVVADVAKRAKCDLIIIATHGLTGPKHLLLGSTTERVVQHAPCSVLVVR